MKIKKKSTWSDIDLTFSKKNNGDINDFQGVDAIKSSIKNIVETMIYQRRMLPDFAGRYHSLLFEPMDEITAGELGEEILEEIPKWEPRIIIENINVKMRPDKNKYSVVITFSLENAYETDVVEVDIIRRG